MIPGDCAEAMSYQAAANPGALRRRGPPPERPLLPPPLVGGPETSAGADSELPLFSNDPAAGRPDLDHAAGGGGGDDAAAGPGPGAEAGGDEDNGEGGAILDFDTPSDSYVNLFEDAPALFAHHRPFPPTGSAAPTGPGPGPSGMPLESPAPSPWAGFGGASGADHDMHHTSPYRA